MKYSEIALPSNKKFGIFFSFVFICLAIYFIINLSNYLALLFFILAIIFFVLSFIAPFTLSYLNKSWMFIGYIIGLIISPIVLGLIFFFFITPIALIFKIFGRDELKIKKNNLQTYWLNRKNIELSTKSFNDQF